MALYDIYLESVPFDSPITDIALSDPTVTSSIILTTTSFANISSFGLNQLILKLAQTSFVDVDSFGTQKLVIQLKPTAFTDGDSFGLDKLVQILHQAGYVNVSTFGAHSISEVFDGTLRPHIFVNPNVFFPVVVIRSGWLNEGEAAGIWTPENKKTGGFTFENELLSSWTVEGRKIGGFTPESGVSSSWAEEGGL